MLVMASEVLEPPGEVAKRKASHTYVLMVQHLIEKCLLLQLDREQCVRALAKHARVLPAVTTVVWQELEKENKDFFAEYARKRQEEHRTRAAVRPRATEQLCGPAALWSCPEAAELLRQQHHRQHRLQQHYGMTPTQQHLHECVGSTPAGPPSRSTGDTQHVEVSVGYPVNPWGGGGAPATGLQGQPLPAFGLPGFPAGYHGGSIKPCTEEFPVPEQVAFACRFSHEEQRPSPFYSAASGTGPHHSWRTREEESEASTASSAPEPPP